MFLPFLFVTYLEGKEPALNREESVHYSLHLKSCLGHHIVRRCPRWALATLGQLKISTAHRSPWMKLFRDAPQHTEHNNAPGPQHSFHKEAHGHRNLLFCLYFFKLSILVESSPDSCSLLLLLSLTEKVYVVNEAARRPLFTRRRRKALASDKASRFCKILAVPTG